MFATENYGGKQALGKIAGRVKDSSRAERASGVEFSRIAGPAQSLQSLNRVWGWGRNRVETEFSSCVGDEPELKQCLHSVQTEFKRS